MIEARWRKIIEACKREGYDFVVRIAPEWTGVSLKAAFVKSNFHGDYFSDSGDLIDWEIVQWVYGNDVQQIVLTAGKHLTRRRSFERSRK